MPKLSTTKIRNALMLIRTLSLRFGKETDEQIDLIVKEIEKLEDGSAGVEERVG